MAFNVAPTSGTVPFVFTADFYSRYALDTGLYRLQFYVNTMEGSCPNGNPLGTSQTEPVLAILDTGTYIQTTGYIPIGSCRTVTLVIREVETNEIISQEMVNIDNLE